MDNSFSEQPLVTRQLIDQIIKKEDLAKVQFGFVKIGAAAKRPINAAADWDFKHNPHFHVASARSAIVFLYPYQLVNIADAANAAKLASIGYHVDYHSALAYYLERVVAALSNLLGNFDYKIFVDKDGLDDVKFALKAGLGSVAKNSMLLNEQYGTAHNIGYILSTLAVEAKPIEQAPDYCLNCNRCEVACPNQALTNRTVLQQRCRSSLNQKKGTLNSREIDLIGNWFYGCDICQYACPYNSVKSVDDGAIDLNEVMLLTKKTFRQYHQTKSYGYLGLTRLKRNAMILLSKQLGIAALEPYRAIIERSPLLLEQYKVLVNKEL